MLKFFSSILLLILFENNVTSQSIKSIVRFISLGNYVDGKNEADAYVIKYKNDPEGWFYKGKIYVELARQDNNEVLPFDALKEAFEAFKKYQQLDPKNTLMILDQNVGLFQVYDIYYNRGVKYYNDKSYDKSFENLKNAMDLEDYIQKRGYSYNNFTFPVLDTQLVNLTASSAYLAKKEDESIPYFERLADAKISAKNYKEVYGLLAQYYSNKGDKVKAEKYLTLGKQFFPDNEYWVGIEFGPMPEDKDKRMARYEQLLQKYPDNYSLNMDYSIELFNSLYSVDKKPTDYPARQQKLKSLITKTISINSTALANFVMSQHIYNEIYDVEDALRPLKGNAPGEAAKRRTLNAQREKLYDEMYPYAQKAYDLYSQEREMSSADKGNYRKVINELINYYQVNHNNSSVSFYQNKLSTIGNSNNVYKEEIKEDKNQSKVVIKMQKEGGVYKTSCNVNGLKLNFIFDTGASDVSISLTEALFMLKNGYLDKSDIIGSQNYQTADGNISEGTIINLKELSIGGMKLYNVKASIINKLDAPLLLGQSALSKLGKFEFNYNESTLIIYR